MGRLMRVGSPELAKRALYTRSDGGSGDNQNTIPGKIEREPCGLFGRQGNLM